MGTFLGLFSTKILRKAFVFGRLTPLMQRQTLTFFNELLVISSQNSIEVYDNVLPKGTGSQKRKHRPIHGTRIEDSLYNYTEDNPKTTGIARKAFLLQRETFIKPQNRGRRSAFASIHLRYLRLLRTFLSLLAFLTSQKY
jgi:hypothetical protein